MSALQDARSNGGNVTLLNFYLTDDADKTAVAIRDTGLNYQSMTNIIINNLLRSVKTPHFLVDYSLRMVYNKSVRGDKHGR